jgi:lipoprotein-releasing system ATP-binding protein
MDQCLLQACEVTKVYGTVVKTKVIKGIDLSISPGEFISLIGYSGSGKTTFLNILGALDQPTEGKLFFENDEVTAMDDRALAYFRNRNLGFVFQFHHLLPEFTVLENVMIPSWILEGKVNDKRKARAKELLELVGLQDHISKKATQISGGQQQRVAIARSLINDPRLILADEPTGNLDSESTEQVYGLLRDINKTLGTAFLVVTHNDHIAAKSDRIIVLKDGMILRDESIMDKDGETVWQSVAPRYCKQCQKESILK